MFDLEMKPMIWVKEYSNPDMIFMGQTADKSSDCEQLAPETPEVLKILYRL